MYGQNFVRLRLLQWRVYGDDAGSLRIGHRFEIQFRLSSLGLSQRRRMYIHLESTSRYGRHNARSTRPTSNARWKVSRLQLANSAFLFITLPSYVTVLLSLFAFHLLLTFSFSDVRHK